MRRFTPTALLITGGLLLWLANFIFVYGFAAVACAKGFADVQLVGLRVVPLTAILSSLLTAGATAALLLMARKRQRDEQRNEHTSFIRFLTLITCVIALLALLLLTIPLVMVEGCYRV